MQAEVPAEVPVEVPAEVPAELPAELLAELLAELELFLQPWWLPVQQRFAFAFFRCSVQAEARPLLSLVGHRRCLRR